MTERQYPETIKFEPALPCSSPTAGGGYCGQPATVAMVTAMTAPDLPGGPRFVLQPICEQCVKRWMEVYE